MQIPAGFSPISEAQYMPYGTEAILVMENGRRYRATWTWRNGCCAWWPDDPRRKRAIGLYCPIAFKVTRAAGAKIILFPRQVWRS